MGINKKITVYGRYVGGGNNNTILLQNVHDKLTKEFLCDQLYINSSKVPYNRQPNDFIVVKGIISEYNSRSKELGYTISPTHCRLIRPMTLGNNTVYVMGNGFTKYWYYKDEPSHLYEGDEEEPGYEIIYENGEYCDLGYSNERSFLRVYKSIDAALSYF